MDRLHHLRQTLPRNIQNSSSHSDVEFVLLDYGGKDGVESWAKEELSSHIADGRVVFCMTETAPDHFFASHAKNIAHKVASGDILCNLDSDILIPKGFCEYLDSIFSINPKLIIAFDSDDPYGNHGCAGIVAARKEHFYSVNGYDESIRMGWGYDDMNFQFRCRMHNSLELFVPPKICLCIPHSNEIRTANFPDKDIEKTRRMSMEICERSALDRDYVANKSGSWGECKIFKNFSDTAISV